MAIILVFNGPGRMPIVETVKSTAEAMQRFAEDPSCVVIDGRVLEIQQRTVTLIDGQPADTPRREVEKEAPDAAPNPWLCPAEVRTSGQAEHLVDVVGSSAGEPSSAPSQSAGERPDPSGTGPSSGTGTGEQG